MIARLLAILVVLHILDMSLGANHKMFKTCFQDRFCERNRRFARKQMDRLEAKYHYFVQSYNVSRTSFYALLQHSQRDGPTLQLNIAIYSHGILHCEIEEVASVHKRFKPGRYGAVILEEGQKLPIEVVEGEDKLRINSSDHESYPNMRGSAEDQGFTRYEAEIQLLPFMLTYKVNGTTVLEANKRGLMNYEEYRNKSKQTVWAEKKYDATRYEKCRTELWQDKYKGECRCEHSIPYGPSSVALDFDFPLTEQFYGIPEHCHKFALNSSREPFRLFNTDVYAYEEDSKMALYGTVPYVVSYSRSFSTQLLWVNAADTWVDLIERTNTSHWISEAGTIDFYAYAGRTTQQLLAKLHLISGNAPMPNYFSLGYHQCRFSYMSSEDVEDVDEGFDIYSIPYDTIWLDIDHTDKKQYFTWNYKEFATPGALLTRIGQRTRHVVAIVDPHIRKDDGYYVYNRGLNLTRSSTPEVTKNAFIQKVQGGELSGNCWPGTVVYMDFLNEPAQELWESLFSFGEYNHSQPHLFIWNDMNEPSMFQGPEASIPKNAIHKTAAGESYEHRELHNMYGFLNHRSTFRGLMKRSTKTRPFVLTRSFFLGSQRYGAVWTGDNTANWRQYELSIDMLLSLALGGISFAGADVGGYKDAPSEELLYRWYQLGVFYPFFRGHSQDIAPRREPWLFSKQTKDRIRDAILMRYRLLPYLYTLFYEYSVYSAPILRPLFYHFPSCHNVSVPGFMFGPDMLVYYATAPNQTFVRSLYLPVETTWYDYSSGQRVASGTHPEYQLQEAGPAVFVRGGSIIPVYERLRRSANLLTKLDPLSLAVYLDSAGSAEGFVYLDDGKTWEYERNKKFGLYKVQVNQGKEILGTRVAGKNCKRCRVEIEKILISGAKTLPAKVLGSNKRELKFASNNGTLEIERVGAWLGEEGLKIELLYQKEL